MKRAMVLGLLLAAATLCGLPLAQAQQPALEVITLKHRNADQVIPVLKPLLAPGGTLSGMQNRLIVRTTPQNLAELRQVLATLDAAPRRLLISVRQEGSAESARGAAEASGSVGSGDVRATVPDAGNREGGTVVLRRGDNRVRARIQDSRSAATDRSVQTLQVTEGGEAWIQVGQAVAVQGSSVSVGPQGTQTARTTTYRDTGSGFRVRPRVSGATVTLEISTRRDSVADADSQHFNVQRVDTVVTGRLGEWLELGGIARQGTLTERGTLSRRTGSDTDERRVFLKVEELQ